MVVDAQATRRLAAGGGASTYLSPRLLEARGGIRTKPKVERNGTEGNGWCDEPFEPVRDRWAVHGDTLTLTLSGPSRCNGQDQIWAGQWSRVR